MGQRGAKEGLKRGNEKVNPRLGAVLAECTALKPASCWIDAQCGRRMHATAVRACLRRIPLARTGGIADSQP